MIPYRSLFEASSKVPELLYHATYRKYLKRILKEGLQPRSISGVKSNYEHDDREPSFEFIFMSPDKYVAVSYAEVSDEWSGDIEDIICFEVKTTSLDKSKFIKDPYTDSASLVYRGSIPPSEILLIDIGE